MRRIYRTGLATAAVLPLAVAAPGAQQQTATCVQVAPVCAVKAGAKQSYWNECQARRDGALVILTGECPAQPNSEGGGGSGGM